MTVSSTSDRVSYIGTDSTDTYSYPFKIFQEEDLLVTIQDTNGTESEKVLNTDYTVTGAGDLAGGSVVLTAGNLTTDYVITIRRFLSVLQETDIRNTGQFLPQTIEDQFDKDIMIAQQQQNEIDRSVKLPETVDGSDFNPTLPTGIFGSIGKSPVTNALGSGWADASGWPSSADIANAQTYATQAAASAAAAASSGGFNTPDGLANAGLSASVGSNALTINLTQANGSSEPSTDEDSVSIYFRSVTATSGAVIARSVIAALSIIVPSGATLGHNDNATEFIYVYAIDNAGTVELAVSSSNHWDEGSVVTTIAIGTGSDNGSAIYSTSQRTNVPIRYIGRLTIANSTAGAWANAPSVISVGFLQNKYGETVSKSSDFNAKHAMIYLVDSTGGAINVQLPDPANGPISFRIIDSAANFSSDNVTLVRNGSEEINGSGADFDMIDNSKIYDIISDGTDWFVTANDEALTELVSVTRFDGPTSNAAIPNSWTTLTLSAAAFTAGTAVSRSTNDLTFPWTGPWKLTFNIGDCFESSTNVQIGVRMRNTTDGTTADKSVLNRAALADGRQSQGMVLTFNVTDILKVYQIQWASDQGSPLAQGVADLDGEAMYAWRGLFEYIGERLS